MRLLFFILGYVIYIRHIHTSKDLHISQLSHNIKDEMQNRKRL